MSIDLAAARERARRTKRFLAACGLAGCLGGAAAASAFAESPAAPARSEQLFPSGATGDTTGRARLRLFDALRNRPIWSGASAKKAEPASNPARKNPFVTDESPAPAARTAAKARPAAAVRVADGVQSAKAPVRRVNHAETTRVAETTPACAYPGEGDLAAATDAPSKASRDGRLPPAAPFGSTNPFATAKRSGAAQAEAIPQDATPVSARPAVVPFQTASQTARTYTGEKPVPVVRSLAEGRAHSAAPGEVMNDDMIVNSALVPKRTDWRSETLPGPSEPERIDYPITPRKPFAAPAWQTADATKPTVTSNLPVTLAPNRTVETETVSVANVPQTPAELPKFEPTAAPAATAAASENPFGAPAAPAVSEMSETAKEEPTLAALPTITPGPALPALSAPGPALTMPATETGPILAVATPKAVPTRLAEFGGAAVAKPVDLAPAEQAMKQDQRPSGVVGTPLAVGLALAVVAIGAVIIRRRFA